MVDKDFLEYIEAEIGRSIEPYDSEAPLTTEEALEEYSGWMVGSHLWEGFNDSSKVIYHSGSDQEENRARFELLEAVALDMREKGKSPEFYLNQDLRELVASSDIIEEGEVTYHEADTLEGEIREPFRRSVDGRSIHVTSDYEADTVYRFRESFDSSEFIVLSADTSELEDVPTALDQIRQARRKPDWS